MFSLTVLGLEAWDQGIGRNALSLKALEENVFHAFLWASGVASRPWPALAISASMVTGPSFFCESVSSQGFSSLCLFVSLCVSFVLQQSFPGSTSGKESACPCRRHKRRGFRPWVGKIPWRRAWQPTPVFLPAESHGQRSLAGYHP